MTIMGPVVWSTELTATGQCPDLSFSCVTGYFTHPWSGQRFKITHARKVTQQGDDGCKLSTAWVGKILGGGEAQAES